MSKKYPTWTAWSDEDCRAAAKIYAEIHTRYKRIYLFKIIGNAIGRTYWGVRTRFIDYGPTFTGVRRSEHNLKRPSTHAVLDGQIEIPQGVLEERARRVVLEPTSVTAMLCGDPLPGYSALDQMRVVGKAA